MAAAAISGSKWVPLRERTTSTAASAPAVRSNTSQASATCEIRAANDSCAPDKVSGTPRPSQRAYACSTPVRTSVPSPRRSANAPAAAQCPAICSTTARPPLAMNAAVCSARLNAGGAVPDPSQHEHHRRESGQILLNRMRPEVDVVAEDLRGFVPVGRAADVGQQADVVERGQLRGVEAESRTETHSDARRPQHVLGRLPEAEVGDQRHRHQQVGEPNPRIGHGRDCRTARLG